MRRKNIMMVLLDGCRAKSVGCLGYRARETTPVIDRLAERGTVVERLYSTSNCTMPSVISMFTGVYPALHRATPTWGYYDGKYPYLPQILREHGYQTFFAANAIAAMSPEWGFIAATIARTARAGNITGSRNPPSRHVASARTRSRFNYRRICSALDAAIFPNRRRERE